MPGQDAVAIPLSAQRTAHCGVPTKGRMSVHTAQDARLRAAAADGAMTTTEATNTTRGTRIICTVSPRRAVLGRSGSRVDRVETMRCIWFITNTRLPIHAQQAPKHWNRIPLTGRRYSTIYMYM